MSSASDFVKEPIYFSGRPEPEIPGEVAEEPDLNSMSPFEYDVAFGMWLNLVWFHSTDIPLDPMELLRTGFSIKNLDRQFRAYSVTNGLSTLDRGSTVEEMWYTNQLISRRKEMLIVNRTQPGQPYERIARKAFLSPRDIVHALKLVLEEGSGVVTLSFDGRTGHCIYMHAEDQDTGDLVFYDPEPGQSLLCAENNGAGVDVRRWGNGNNWLISPSDLEKVVFAVLVDTHLWESITAELSNIPDSADTFRDGWSDSNTVDRKRNWWLKICVGVILAAGAIALFILLSGKPTDAPDSSQDRLGRILPFEPQGF